MSQTHNLSKSIYILSDKDLDAKYRVESKFQLDNLILTGVIKQYHVIALTVDIPEYNLTSGRHELTEYPTYKSLTGVVWSEIHSGSVGGSGVTVSSSITSTSTSDAASSLAVKTLNDEKLAANFGVGADNRRLVVDALGTVNVLPALGSLTTVELVDTGDVDLVPDSLRFTFVGGSVIDLNINQFFDIGAIKEVKKNDTTNYILDVKTLGDVTSSVDLTSWFDNTLSRSSAPVPSGLKVLNEKEEWVELSGGVEYDDITKTFNLTSISPYVVYVQVPGTGVNQESLYALDTNGVPGDISRPYLTLDRAIDFLKSTNSKGSGWEVHIIGRGTNHMSINNRVGAGELNSLDIKMNPENNVDLRIKNSILSGSISITGNRLSYLSLIYNDNYTESYILNASVIGINLLSTTLNIFEDISDPHTTINSKYAFYTGHLNLNVDALNITLDGLELLYFYVIQSHKGVCNIDIINTTVNGVQNSESYLWNFARGNTENKIIKLSTLTNNTVGGLILTPGLRSGNIDLGVGIDLEVGDIQSPTSHVFIDCREGGFDNHLVDYNFSGLRIEFRKDSVLENIIFRNNQDSILKVPTLISSQKSSTPVRLIYTIPTDYVFKTLKSSRKDTFVLENIHFQIVDSNSNLSSGIFDLNESVGDEKSYTLSNVELSFSDTLSCPIFDINNSSTTRSFPMLSLDNVTLENNSSYSDYIINADPLSSFDPVLIEVGVGGVYYNKSWSNNTALKTSMAGWKSIKAPSREYVPILGSFTMKPEYTGKVLVVEASNVICTIPMDLPDNFTTSMISTSGNGFTVSPGVGGVTLEAPNGLSVTGSGAITIGRLKYGAVDKFIIM